MQKSIFSDTRYTACRNQSSLSFELHCWRISLTSTPTTNNTIISATEQSISQSNNCTQTKESNPGDQTGTYKAKSKYAIQIGNPRGNRFSQGSPNWIPRIRHPPSYQRTRRRIRRSHCQLRRRHRMERSTLPNHTQIARGQKNPITFQRNQLQIFR